MVRRNARRSPSSSQCAVAFSSCSATFSRLDARYTSVVVSRPLVAECVFIRKHGREEPLLTATLIEQKELLCRAAEDELVASFLAGLALRNAHHERPLIGQREEDVFRRSELYSQLDSVSTLDEIFEETRN